MNIFKKAGIYFKAFKKSNKLTMLSTMKNVYKQYGWKALKDAVLNKAQGKQIIPNELLNLNAEYVRQEMAKKDKICQEIFKEQQSEMTKEEIIKDIARLSYKPLVSIVMPIYNAPVQWLETAINSIRDQYYDHWELCIVDDGSTDGRGKFLVNKFAQADSRIRLKALEKNTGISGASNVSLEMAKGEYVALIDQDDEITPDAFYWFIKEINKNKGADFIYSDECKIDITATRRLFDFMFKPDWSPSFLLNYMYTGHLTMYRTELVKKIGGFRTSYDFSQDYDLALRASEQAKQITHIERILYFWRALPDSGAADGKQHALTTNIMAARDWYDRHGLLSIAERREYGNYSKLILEKHPKISIVVPSDSYKDLKTLIQNINLRTSYTNYEIVPVTNSLVAEKLGKNLPYYKNILNVCKYDKIFNFSDKCNQGAKASTGDVLIFFNDDAYPRTTDWIERLLDIVYLPDVGGVSPVMLYEGTDTIQYGGGITVHPYLGINGTAYYFRHFDETFRNKIHQKLVRDVSVLSGACLAIQKEIFMDINGFDPVNTPNGHSDVDISFRLWEKGLRCAITPYSVLYHPGRGTWTKTCKKDKADLYCLKKYGKNFERDRFFTDSMKRFEFDGLTYKIYFPDNFDGSKGSKGDILLMSHELTRTGSPVVLFDMAKELMKEGYFVIVTSPFDGPLRKDMCEAGLVVIIDESLLKYRFMKEEAVPQDEYWHLDTFIANFDLVVVCAMLNHNIINRYNNTKIPIIWWMHEGNLSLDFMEDYLPKELGDNIQVKCGGQYVRDMLKLYHVNYETKVLLYGVDDLAKSFADVPLKKIRFLLAGSFEKRKGQDLFIKAIKEMPDEYRKKAEFLFIGRIHEQEIYDEVEAFCLKNKNASVMLTITREELFKIYEETACIVTPSRDDPMPVVLTEGFMLSKICLCSDKTGTSYYIKDGENGFVIKNEDYKDFSKKMMNIIDHYDQLDDLRANGRKLYEKYFKMDMFRKNVREVVEENIRPF